MADIKESLGITNFGPWYIEILPEQNMLEEYLNIANFIKFVIADNDISEFSSDDINIQFINYGKTQLVFVITVDNSKQYTLLINQPATKYGTGKNEFNNLKKLNKKDSQLVINPMYYFAKDNKELYITPYYHQARCVGVEPNTKRWGIWIPEPQYHFKPFKENDKKIINSTMIAMLIKLYDEEKNKGIAKCRLDGGDFMLLKGFESSEISYDNITKNLKLIAARELIDISLEDYIARMRIELANKAEDELIILGKELREPFTEEEIESGIEMGLALRNCKIKPLDNYRSIQRSAFQIRMILNSLDTDIATNNMPLFDYFYDFNSLNFEELFSKLVNNNIPYDKVSQIMEALKILKETYEEYGVNNLDELSTLILNMWNNNKFYSDELIRNVILVEHKDNSSRYTPKSNISLLDIYNDMVRNNMITDPNIPIGSSSERLYTMLPEDSNCYESNLKIISDSTIDWSIYRNGCNPLEHYCYLYNESKSDEERKYYHDLIVTAINSSCSLFNNRFAWHAFSQKTEEIINYYLLAGSDKLGSERHPIKDIEFNKEIHNLLLTDELFNHQMELYTEKNDEADAVIKELVMLRNNKDKIM